MKITTVDRLIAVFSPEWAMNRARSRDLLARSYDGAKKGRRLGSWGGALASANTDIQNDRDALIARSRDLENNDPYAKGAFDSIVTNLVGDGIIPNPYIFNENDETPGYQRELLKLFDAHLEDWADSSDCDYMDMTSLYGIQGLVARTIAKAGMCFVIREFDSSLRGIPFRLKLLEPDFLDTNKNQESSSSVVFKGIQISKKTHRVEGYWFLTEHPDGGVTNKHTSNSVFYPIRDVLAPFHILRPGQLIGVPWLYAALVRLHDFNAYEDAQLVKQKVSATTVTYISRAESDDDDGDDDDRYYEFREPGATVYLNRGETPHEANPPSVDGYGEFSSGALRAVSRAVGLSAEELSQKYDGINFSAGKLSRMAMNRNVKMWRSHMFYPMFLDKLSRWIIAGAQIKMNADLSFIRLKWSAPKQELIDPSKEIAAYAIALKTGQISLPEVYAETGRDFKQAINEMKEAKKAIEDAGLSIEGITNLTLNVGDSQNEDDNATSKA